MKKTYSVSIEEIIVQTFEVEANSFEEAMEIAEQKYYDGEFVLDNAEVSCRNMSATDNNGHFTEWTEF